VNSISRSFLFLLAFFPAQAFAQAYSGECGSCVERKQRMCADECELVTPEKSRKCQKNCIAEYCAHKCEKTAPELDAYLRENCEECLERQYMLCEAHCPEGRPRKRAVCQVDCSNERCDTLCQSDKKVTPAAPKSELKASVPDAEEAQESGE